MILVYVGTRTHGRREAIFVYRMDASSGALELSSKAEGVDDPMFLDIDPQRRRLYAVEESVQAANGTSGTVAAFSILPETGELSYLNRQPSQGLSPCHLTVDQTGGHVFVANFVGGSLGVLPILDDGRLGEATGVVRHEGSGVGPGTQEDPHPLQDGPHPHSITLDSANRHAFVADIGIDKVMVYKVDVARGKLRPHGEVHARSGAGPRHFDFHPTGRYAYLINQLDSTLTAFSYDASSGSLTEFSTVAALPEGFEGPNDCADVHASPSGGFVYGSNRGHDSIVIFEVAEGNGRLTYVGHEPTQGETPVNFAIDPTGTFMLVANQDSGNVVVFRIDESTGKLTPTGHAVEVPEPSCIKIVRFPS